MAATATAEKACRMDVRLTQPQRSSYERAASLKGQTLSQWATQNLDACAQRDIEYATHTTLADEAFEAFCALLDEPMPHAATDLLAQKSIWI